MNKKLLKYRSNDILIEYFISEYSRKKKPIPVSFKSLLPELNNADRFTHLIHTYPAKLLVHIPYFFLNNEIISKKGDVVLDPFCGTGTVLLESILAGRDALGAEANPLAKLIADVKTSKLNAEALKSHLVKITKKAKLYKNFTIPEVVNIQFWFPEKTQIQLAKLLRAIKTIEDRDIRNFFFVCLSNCIKKVSFADPRISVPVKLNPNRFAHNSKERILIEKRLRGLKDCDVFCKFDAVCSENIIRVMKLAISYNGSCSRIVSDDARHLSKGGQHIANESVDLIITSPPYAGAQKYIRSSSLSLGWLEIATPIELRSLDERNIGRENYHSQDLHLTETGISKADLLIKKIFSINKTRAHIVGNYLVEMKDALDESFRVLKRSGFLVLIIGNNKVCNYEFNTQSYITEYLEKKGMQLQFKLIDDIKSYGLMTKRNKTADIISREWILVFKK